MLVALGDAGPRSAREDAGLGAADEEVGDGRSVALPCDCVLVDSVLVDCPLVDAGLEELPGDAVATIVSGGTQFVRGLQAESPSQLTGKLSNRSGLSSRDHAPRSTSKLSPVIEPADPA